MRMWQMIFMALSLAFLASCQQPPPPAQSQAQKSVRLMLITTPAAAPTRTLAGTVRATQKADLSFSIPGKITRIDVKPGDSVRKAQKLAELDAQPYDLRLQSAKADYEKAIANFNEKKLTHQAYHRLHQGAYVSKVNYEKVRAAMQVASSQVAAVKAALALAQRDTQQTILSAPFEGVIAERLAEPFVEVNAGRVILKLHGTKQFEVAVQVPDTFIHQLTLDQSVVIVLPTLNKLKLNGTISEISATAEVANSFEVRVELRSPPARLFDGMTAEVTFPTIGVSGGHAIPLSALVNRAGWETASVFVFNEQNQQVSAVPVRIVDINQTTVIVSGLKTGIRIVISGAGELQTGQLVRAIEEPDT